MTKRAFEEYEETKTGLGSSFFRSLVLTVQTSIVKDLNKKLAKKRKVLRKLKKAGLISKVHCGLDYCDAQTYVFADGRFVGNWMSCGKCSCSYCEAHWEVCDECCETVCDNCMDVSMNLCEDCKEDEED